jgi:fibrillarin-like pre-rRNA processing protein
VSLPDGVEHRTIDGETALATRGPVVGDEATADGWRRWDRRRSKLAAMLAADLDTSLRGGETVLYLGASAGTTVGHVADFAGPSYAVEFAPRPMRDLVAVAEQRPNLFPLLKDARSPETYAHVVEPVDVVVQDVATRGQAAVATRNARFLRPDGRLILAVKARSEDATREPHAIFEEVLAELSAAYAVLDTIELAPTHADHLGVVAAPR